jgi:hypothetical protein
MEDQGLFAPRLSRLYFSGDSIILVMKVARLFEEITDSFLVRSPGW